MFNIFVSMSYQILFLSVQQCYREMEGVVGDFKIIIENNVSFSGQRSIVAAEQCKNVGQHLY